MTSDSSLPAVAVLGLGKMGSAFADRLIVKGVDVTVWNRHSDRARPYGDRAAPTITEAVRHAKVVLTCLRDHAATVSSVKNAATARALRGRTLVVLSSMAAEESRELGSWAERHGIAYLEAQIQDYPSTVRTGNATILCSGPAPVFETVRHALCAVSARFLHVSELPGGATTLIAAQLAFALHTYVGVLHGAAMCRAADMDPTVFLRLMVSDYMREGPLSADLEKMVTSAIAGNYGEDVGATLDVWRLSLEQVIAESREAGLDTDHLKSIHVLVSRAIANGHGEHDFEAVTEVMASAP